MLYLMICLVVLHLIGRLALAEQVFDLLVVQLVLLIIPGIVMSVLVANQRSK